MKVRKSIRKWTEPLVYTLLVAAFGLVTSLVTPAKNENPVRENKNVVSYTIEDELESLTLATESKEISL
jgi:hypothetical protein